MNTTQGPWVVRTFPTLAHGLDAYWVLDAIPDRDGKVVANAICSMAATNDHAPGNARLIAAAPELLESTITLLNYLNELTHRGIVFEEDVEVIQNQARAAIAKAEGR